MHQFLCHSVSRNNAQYDFRLTGYGRIDKYEFAFLSIGKVSTKALTFYIPELIYGINISAAFILTCLSAGLFICRIITLT